MVLVYFAAYGSTFAGHSELGVLGFTENVNKIHVYDEGEFPLSFYQSFHRLIGDNCGPIDAVAVFGAITESSSERSTGLPSGTVM